MLDKMFWACNWLPERQNFGDVIGRYIVEKLTGVLCSHSMPEEGPHLMVCGSILSVANEHSTVWGSGFLSQGQAVTAPPANICAVRGPLSRLQLSLQGIECLEVYGDPALLLPRVHPYFPVFESNEPLFIPHYEDEEHIELSYPCTSMIVTPENTIEDIIGAIRGASCVITSSLHGLIVAHAYDVPALLVRWGDRLAGDGMKFRDYFLSVGITPYKPVDATSIPPGELVGMVPMNTGSFDPGPLLEAFPYKVQDNVTISV